MKCWPARYGVSSERARRNVFARAVSLLTSSTFALCQRPGPGAGGALTVGAALGAVVASAGGAPAGAGCDAAVGGASSISVALVALLEPRVAVVVVAVDLPEARLVVVQQTQPGHPLRALPEVQVRH